MEHYNYLMNSYISALLDFRTTNNVIDCKDIKIAKKVQEVTGGKLKGVKLTITDPDFLEKFCPTYHYEDYRIECMKSLKFPLPKPVPNHEYMAAIFDIFGSFKLNKREKARNYAVVTFRSKKILEVMSHFYKKSYTDQIIFNGTELLFALEGLKEHLILRGERARILCNVVADPADQENYAEWLAVQDT